jgi:hypothetical protein
MDAFLILALAVVFAVIVVPFVFAVIGPHCGKHELLAKQTTAEDERLDKRYTDARRDLEELLAGLNRQASSEFETIRRRIAGLEGQRVATHVIVAKEELERLRAASKPAAISYQRQSYFHDGFERERAENEGWKADDAEGHA